MKPKLLLLGVGAACAACCAALVAPALLVLLGVGGTILLSPIAIEIAVIAVVLGGVAVYLLWRRARASGCAENQSCECKESCDISKP